MFTVHAIMQICMHSLILTFTKKQVIEASAN